MSDMQQNERAGAPGTPEGETGPSESDPVAPSVEDREAEPDAEDDQAG